MNWKRYFLTVVAIFLAANVTGFLIHGLLLEPDYKSFAQLYRTGDDAQRHLYFIWIAYLGFALGSIGMYAKGVEAKPWLGQGLRFGVAVWMVLDVPSFLIAHAVQPIPYTLTARQLGYELIDKLLLGALTAALYRSAGAKDTEARSLAA